MALLSKSIDYDNSLFVLRLDAKFHHLHATLKNYKSTNLASLEIFDNYILSITDGEHTGQTFVPDGVLFLKNSSIKDFDISKNDGFYITKEKHEQLKGSALKEEDILFTTIGHLGSAAIVPVGFGKANMNQNFVKITVDKSKGNPYYITCFLNSKFVRKQVSCLLTGNIQSILTYPKIRNIKIAYPKNEQIIKDIEKNYREAIELSKKAEILIKEAINIFEFCLLKKFMHKNEQNNIYTISNTDLVNNIWTPKYHYPKYLNMEKYIKLNFEWDYISNIADLNNGDEPGSDFYNTYLDKADADLAFVRTSDIYNYQVDLLPDNFIDKKMRNLLKQNLFLNDIIFTKDGKIGETAILTKEDDIILASGNEFIRINDVGKEKGYTEEYLFTALSCKYIGKYNSERYTVVASTIPHLKENYIKKFVIPKMAFSEIKEISQKINKAFSYINKKKQLIKICRNIIDNFTDNLDL